MGHCAGYACAIPAARSARFCGSVVGAPILSGDRIQSVEATTSSVHGPTLATRATVEVGAWEGAGRAKRPRSKASIMAAECGSERRRSRACPGEGRGRAERSEASREAGALTAEHAAARSGQIDHSHPDPYFGERT